MTYYVISDTHLSHNTSIAKQMDINFFLSMITDNDRLIICGDFLDFWASYNTDIITANQSVLKNLPKNTRILMGNHDYSMAFEGHNISTYHQETIGDKSFYFTHGYELDVAANYEGLGLDNYEDIADYLCKNGNTIGTVLTLLWKYLSDISNILSITRAKVFNDVDKMSFDINRIRALAEASGRRFIISISDDNHLIYGHTHVPYLGKISSNSGAFPDYLKIDNLGTVSLHRWKEDIDDNLSK